MSATLRTALSLLLAVVALFGLSTAAQAAPKDPGLIKVYVVKSADQNGGQADTLASIAQRTLGDPNRANEIFTLNKGLPQADGSALTTADEALHPGWILRLPDDASGTDVQLGRLTSGDNAKQSTFTWKVVTALVVAVLLALVTLAVVFRRRVGRTASAVFRRLTGPITRRMAARRQQQRRRQLRDAFAQDRVGPELARRAIAELGARTPGRTEVYAVSTGQDGVTAWLTASDEPPAPWRDLGDGRWQRAGAADIPAVGAPTATPVRVGADGDRQFYVDLSWLDGVLAVDGDPAIAAATVQAISAELAAAGTRVAAVGAPGAYSVAQLRGMLQSDIRRHHSVGSTVLAAAQRRTVTGVLVAPNPLAPGEAEQLLELCADAEVGPVAVVAGPLRGAHWQWHARPDGVVELPILGLTVTIPG